MLPGNVQMVYWSKDGRTFQNWYASANDSLALQTREQNNIEHDLCECYTSISLRGYGMQTLIRKISELMQMQKIIT